MSLNKITNLTHIEGTLYQHNLESKVTGPTSKKPGTPFIRGSIDIATDNNMTNVVTVYFTYVTETTSKGKVNSTFTILNNIINGTVKTYMEDPAKAPLVSINSALALNEWYTEENGEETLVSQKRNEGGFLNIITALNEKENARSTFKTDMLITKVTEVEENPEQGAPAKAIVSGYIFDFRGSFLPVSYTAIASGAINYFVGLEATPKSPVFTQVWGEQISETIKRTIVTESAFGPDEVREVTNTRKDFVLTGAKVETYTWGEDMTDEELAAGLAQREVTLAETKKRQDDYKAAKAAAAVANANAIAAEPTSDFKF